MNICEIIEIIGNHLNSISKDKTSSVYGISIETDPYKQLETSVPFVLVEESISKLITNAQGYIYEYLHAIDITCVVSIQNQNRNRSLMKVIMLAENVMNALGKLSDFRYKIIPKETIPGDVIIGSLKCCAVRIVLEVKTLFSDN